MTCVPFIFYKMLREMTFLLEIFSFTSVEIKNISKIFLLKATPVSKIYAALRESKARDFKSLRRLEAFLPSSGRSAKDAKNTS